MQPTPTHNPPTVPRPWYRQLWPWFIIALPASVVVASVITYFLAMRGLDTVVAKDYYKEGLAVNTDLTRDKRAQALGLTAKITIDDRQVEVKLTTTDAAQTQAMANQPLRLEFENQSFTERSLEVVLLPEGQGVWRARMPANALSQATWIVKLVGGDWRVSRRLENTLPSQVELIP